MLPGSDLDVPLKPHGGSMFKALLITAVSQNRGTDRLSYQKWPATNTQIPMTSLSLWKHMNQNYYLSVDNTKGRT